MRRDPAGIRQFDMTRTLVGEAIASVVVGRSPSRTRARLQRSEARQNNWRTSSPVSTAASCPTRLRSRRSSNCSTVLCSAGKISPACLVKTHKGLFSWFNLPTSGG